MENPTQKKSYEDAKQKAKEFYRTIGRVWCPILGDHIIFNRIGLQHLIRKHGIERPKSEQKRRFALLPVALKVIENPHITARYQPRETVRGIKWRGKKVLISSRIDFWELTEKDNGLVIKIIIRQFKGTKKHFLSVYARKEKSTSE
jgi:hypothetical protein